MKLSCQNCWIDQSATTVADWSMHMVDHVWIVKYAEVQCGPFCLFIIHKLIKLMAKIGNFGIGHCNMEGGLSTDLAKDKLLMTKQFV